MRTRLLLLASPLAVSACSPPGLTSSSDSAESSGGTTQSEGSSGSTDASGSTDTSSSTDGSDMTDSSDGSDTSEPDDCTSEAPGAEILRCGLYFPGGLALDDEWVYYTTQTNENTSIERVRLDGGEYEELTAEAGDARHIKTVDADIYWNHFSVSGALRRMAKVGGPVEDIAVDLYKVNSFFVHEGMIYFSEYSEMEEVSRVDIETGVVEALYLGIDYPGNLVRHGQDLYWGTHTNDGNADNEVMRGTLDGGPAQLVHMDAGPPQFDATHMYWGEFLNPDSVVWRRPLAGGPDEEVAVFDPPGGMLIHGEYVYVWHSSVGGDWSSGGIRRVAKQGGPVEWVAEDQDRSNWLRANDSHLYWLSRTAVVRMALP